MFVAWKSVAAAVTTKHSASILFHVVRIHSIQNILLIRVFANKQRINTNQKQTKGKRQWP